MTPLVRNLILTVLSIVLFTWVMIPPKTKLRLGKDLRGGVSLIYTVQINPGEDAKEVLGKTIEVIRERVDPNGLLEISIVAVGRDRLEITMPLPGPEVKALRAAVDHELADLAEHAISEGTFYSMMRMGPQERAVRMRELAGSDTRRLELLQSAAAASADVSGKREMYEAAVAAGAPEDEQLSLLTALTDASLAFDAAKAAVLRTSVPPDAVRRALVLSSHRPRLLDAKTRESIEFPSPREEALGRLRETHPEARERIDRVVAAHDAYMAKRTTLDDPQELIRLLKGAGVLSFRITVDPGWNPGEEVRLREELREKGPQNVRSSDMHWYKLNAIDKWHDNDLARAERMRADPRRFFSEMGYVVDEYDGEFYMLCWDTRTTRLTQSEGVWAVERASEAPDQFGKPAITFAMNPRGASLLGDLTKDHVQSKMAVLLDDQVYTAPTLQSAISRNGQITGNFSPEERSYIIRVLSAGSLQSKLSPEPISTSILGPQLGADNLRSGMWAGVVAFTLVAGFMVAYYFTSGVIAVFTLAVTAILLLGTMAIAKAAFTMPGIAGVILTFGQAIDANVLIYERMREEFRRGNDLKTAVRLGYSKALSSIIDGNVTNFIVCLVLGSFGTAEVRGFAITMGVGVVATVFAALVGSRAVFDLGIHLGWRKTSMLPMAIPAIQRGLTWTVDWIRLRWVFVTISTVLVAVGMVMVFARGGKMLDTAFLGGTQVTIQFKPDPQTGRPMTLTRPRAQELAQSIGTSSPPGSLLRPLQAAEVSPVNPREDGITSDTFMIKTTVPDTGGAVLNALTAAFGEYVESKPPLAFDGSEASDWRAAPVYRILAGRLGDNIDQPSIGDNVSNRVGGLAVVLRNIRNAQTGERPTLGSLRERLEAMRSQPEFSDTLGRHRDIRVIEGSEDKVVTAVVIVQDPALSFLTSETRFDNEVADREWTMAVESLARSISPASVQSFSPAIAEKFKAQAIVATTLSFAAITLYIWFRFKSLRYSGAALIALVHDVLAVLGMLALCAWLYESPSISPLMVSLGILPFKIDLNMVAALLTVAGYSLNDKIIIMDRIRENKGKVPFASAAMINNAINQTVSRTLITSGTTVIASMTLYVLGGEGVRAFAFALTAGVIVGTYSSIAVAAPIIWSRREEEELRQVTAATVPAV
ncbi:MAG: protein translocase subunit SecD [Phycisphaeraceae bacterium]|nr:protein translocase subunit SecD [Phycisphaerae bacterium]MBX3391724.1 protein translocase subunit SecD [Phycisphaeraceae bacterium]